MPKSLSLFLLLALLLPSSASAAQIATESGIVTTTVPSAAVPSSPTSSTNQPPTIPILYSPHDGFLTGNPRPTLVWRQSSDPDGNTFNYDVYINGVATFLGVSNLGASSGTGYSTTISDSLIYLTPTIDLPEGNNEWFVRAYDIHNDSRSSTRWHFEIDLTAPFILVTDIDTHHSLTLDSREPTSVPSGTSFEVRGPKDIYFTVLTESYATIQLTLTDIDTGEVYTYSVTAADDTAYPYLTLSRGTYSVQLVAVDRVGHTAALPSFTLTVSEVTLPLPQLSPLPIPPELVIPPAPALPPGYSATVQQVTSRPTLLLMILLLLAFAVFALLVLLKKKRYNLLLLQSDGTPLAEATVFHSLPDTSLPHIPVLLSKREPVKFDLIESDQGKLHIPRLTRYSTLTIRTEQKLVIVSLSRSHSPLRLVV